jgi:cell filamentation protein
VKEDPYLQDDGKTLVNKLGIFRDPKVLRREEANLTELRIRELELNGLPAASGFEIVKATHHAIFQDVYPFAGIPRTTPLGKPEYEGMPTNYFLPPRRIEAEGNRLFDYLDSKNRLKGLDTAQFSQQLAGAFGVLSYIHPFREGNGRTQRMVWQHIAREAGHDLSFEGISKERMASVSIDSLKGNNASLQRMFEELMNPERATALREATSFFEKNRTDGFDWQDRYVATTTPGQSYRGQFYDSNKSRFIMYDGPRIYIGDVRDLPNFGRGLGTGDRLEINARAHSAQSTGLPTRGIEPER